ncbi:CehA/McbA family metallohydrolase [Permianibacter sp. IMCC34836]|uniref:CehA/McbA family metallohydrolase n=1 Tax=Permianibacter fluminis TaxID=2738515 RepID=UPI001555A6FE|nr:CehA/McbA family metallohydrolase [Permianibacter fluminis]NQD36361.1 CehA/McbA family metallohydrolase [Permianibacter fluminis]
MPRMWIAFASIGLGLLCAANANAAREPVLKQIQLPHSYYWREMYLPQLSSGPSAAAFLPDGKSVVYSMAGSLWRQALGSDDASELTHGPGYDYQPDVAPDGRSLIFVRHDQDALELWRLDLTTGKQQQLTRSGVSNVEPRLSPDGRQLAFVSTRADEHGDNAGRFNLYLADVTDAGLANIRPLVANRQSKIDRYYYSTFDHAVNPSWSPDGKRIVYVGNPEVAWGSGDLWSVSVSDPNDRYRVLVEETTWAAKPEFAPDGKRLLYSSYQGRQWHQLWLTTATGQSPLPLTFGEFDRRNARWSRDGQRVLYISNEQGNSSLWLQDVIGGKRQQITANSRHFQRPIAELRLQLRDDRGQPLAARVTALASDGRHYGPDDSWLHADDGFDRRQQAHEHHYFHCQQRCVLTAPVGELTLIIQHGFAMSIAQQTLQLKPGSRELTVTLHDNALPAEFGSHLSADLHVHMNYGGQYRQQLAGLAAQAQAEDLDVVYNLIVNKEQRIPDIGEFKTTADQFGPTTIFQGQEFHTSYWGHLGLLHLDDHYLTPDFSSYRHTALASPYPHNGVIADLAHEQQALMGYVHPFDWRIVPEQEKKLTNLLPVDVALGKTDYYELVSFADHLATAEVWHRLLNLGFKLAAAAGTDAMTNYASLRGPVGLNRVFLAVEKPSPTALKAAIKNGHGFVSNAPLLGLTVNGVAPGDTLQLPAGATRVEIHAAVRSNTPVPMVEILHNGKVLKRIKTDRSGMRADFSGALELTESGWILLRAYNPEPHALVQDLYAYGSTNPVWLELPGKPQRAPEDAAYFLRWIDRIIDDAGQRTDYNTEQEREKTLQYLRAGRAVFEEKAKPAAK